MRPPSASADRFQPAGSEIEQDPAFTGDSNTPRKRSKVSRACDECRRKKVGGPFPQIDLLGMNDH